MPNNVLENKGQITSCIKGALILGGETLCSLQAPLPLLSWLWRVKPDSPSGHRVGPEQIKEGTPSKEETRAARGGKGGNQGCPQTSEIKINNILMQYLKKSIPKFRMNKTPTF